IVVHDAARPFASADLISRTIAAAAEAGAAPAAVPARDTLKRAGAGVVAGGPPPTPRASQKLRRRTQLPAPTPPADCRHRLTAALALNDDATDEATLAERAGHEVRLVHGEATNIKITTPDDLIVAEAISSQIADRGLRIDGSAGKPARTGRAGTGYDLHQLI